VYVYGLCLFRIFKCASLIAHSFITLSVGLLIVIVCFILKVRRSLWDHLNVCLYIRLCLSLYPPVFEAYEITLVSVSFSFCVWGSRYHLSVSVSVRVWGLWDHLSVYVSVCVVEAYEITLVSLYPSVFENYEIPLVSMYPSVFEDYEITLVSLYLSVFEDYEITLISVTVFVSRGLRNHLVLYLHIGLGFITMHMRSPSCLYPR
jgi:hypothetical protein